MDEEGVVHRIVDEAVDEETLANYIFCHRALWHSGGFWSYITLVWLFPEENIGIFISTNGGMLEDYQYTSLTTTMYYLADLLLDKEPWLNSSTACSFPEPWKDETDSRLTEISAFLPDISEYTGIYGNEFQPEFILTVNGSSQTQLNFESGRLGGNLYSTQDKDRFLMEITYPWELYVPLMDHNNVTTKTNVTFVREAGTVTSMNINISTNITFTKGVSMLDVISRNTNGSRRLFSAAWCRYTAISLQVFESAIAMHQYFDTSAVDQGYHEFCRKRAIYVFHDASNVGQPGNQTMVPTSVGTSAPLAG
ncbi:uncharacterized protein LOC128219269 [Mya arenaria]|uniref:uncharacterized protein LOC128219269 n=1 Tax=Mya arenaria TaxID=6604 RepID=UPI0022DF8925|nr:uncharacterized protein LOC128219269 [Mya arenaria]